MGGGCIVHCNKVSKPCSLRQVSVVMHEWHYVLKGYFIMKINSFEKYFKEGVLKHFDIFMKFLNISK